jgi:lipopolysaccharide biosynthesis glycosyltransferase
LTKIFATWICIDDVSNASYFPSSKGNSNDWRIQEIYWKCLATCLYSARKFNPNLRLAVFCNNEMLPTVNGVSYKKLFDYLNIEFYITPFEFQTPEGYFKSWRNQFYEFSIFKYIASSNCFDDNDTIVLVDSDCIVTGELSEIYNQISINECITYTINYEPGFVINGITRNDMKNIFESLDDIKLDSVPDYHAGEFFAATIRYVKKIMDIFYPTWQMLLELHKKNLPRLNEEAHVLSYLYYKTGRKGGEANMYIKRMWTDPTTYRNIDTGDQHFKIWHLPAEKRYGFKTFFKFLKKQSFDLNAFTNEQLIKKFERTFQIPQLNVSRKIFFIVKNIAKKIMKK